MGDMIGAIQAREQDISAYHFGFLRAYPTEESRREAAQSLVPGSDKEVIWDYATRTILAAQWGDDLAESHETAKLLYSIDPTRAYYTGQNVLKISGIDFTDIKKLRKGGTIPEYGFSIDIGVIDQDSLPEYGFRPTPRANTPSGAEKNARFLDFQVSLPVVPVSSLDVSRDGTIEVSLPLRERVDFPIYTGSVCLEPNIGLYHATRNVMSRELVFGNTRSFGTIHDLMHAVGGRPKEAFGTLFEEGEASPSKRLPNLTSINS